MSMTGFAVTGDDDVVTTVRFGILADASSGVYRDWIIRPVVNQTHIPGTNRTYTEHMGYEPATVTWTLMFDTVAEYNRLLALYGATGTLTVLDGYQSLQGVPEHILGTDYEHLDNVTLLGIGDTPHFVGGEVETDVTWIRAVDPVTRLAVV